MRYSKQRELVMQTVQNLCDHPTAEEIYDAAVKECPGLSLGTVYRNLNSLVDAGRVRRVSIPGKADRFDHTLPWHSHLYCTVCGKRAMGFPFCSLRQNLRWRTVSADWIWAQTTIW